MHFLFLNTSIHYFAVSWNLQGFLLDKRRLSVQRSSADLWRQRMCEGKAKATAEPLGPWKNSRIPDDEWDMESWRRPRGSVNKFYSLIKVAVLLALLYSYLFTSQFDSYVGVLGLQAKQRRKHTGKELLKEAISSRLSVSIMSQCNVFASLIDSFYRSEQFQLVHG